MSGHKRAEPKLGEPKLVHPEGAGGEGASPVTIAQELKGENVSDTLVRARQQCGQDLRSIAQVLCIRFSYLDAIERGQYENLPGATYAVGFVRTYAEYLGLDGDKVVERFKSEVEGLDSQTKLHFPTPAPEGKMPGGAVFLVAALLFAGAYGVWFYLSNQGGSLADLVAPVPEHLQGLVDGGAPAAPAESQTPVAAAPSLPSASGAATPGGPEAAGTAAAPTETAPMAGPAEGNAIAAAGPRDPAMPVEQAAEPLTAVPPAALPAAPAPAVAAPLTPATAQPPAAQIPATADPNSPAAPAGPPAAAAAAASPLATPAPTLSTGTTPATGATPVAGSPPAGAPVQPAATTPEAAAAATPPAEAATPAASPSAGEPYAIPAAPDSAAAAAFLINHEPRVYGEENAGARIVLKANQDAWVQVRDRQGTLLLTRVLRVGDSYLVPNEADLTLLTGNAGGLEVSVDGRALEPLGPVGAVRRNIPLDPEALINGAGRQP